MTQRRREGPVPVATKVVYALGDHTVNIALSALTLLYLRFLIDVAGLRPALAGLVPWVGRIVDALSDPLMGRLSDRTPWRWGRRRPYFVLGAIPFGVCFALLWAEVPWTSQAARFAYYAGIYVLLSLSMTVVSVPYLALIPEMARDYDERTSLNTYRAAAAVLGVFVAVGMRPLAGELGGGARGWWLAGLCLGAWLAAPWLAVHAVSWERPLAGGEAAVGLRQGLRALAGHAAYRNLATFYLLGRIAVDIVSVMLLFYVADVIGRGEDFERVMFLFLSVVVLALPVWLQLARRFDKRSIFLAGVLWWIAVQLVLFTGGPGWSRGLLFAVAGLAALGYAVADLMPWAMLPDVIDEDELRSGQRREGLYYGTFTLLRKLGGATAILLTGVVLDLAGYVRGAPRQPESAQLAIRWLMALVPAGFLVTTAWIARGYPLGRQRHAAIRARLAERGGGA